MKNPEYVALVTGVYRAALDRAVDDPEGYRRPRRRDWPSSRESFSRGFTEAYLLGERGNEMMSYQRPNNRGVFVGRVVAAESGRGDDRARVPARRRGHHRVLDVLGPVRPGSRRAGVRRRGARDRACRRSSDGPRPSAARLTGDRVFRVRNAALSVSAARRTFERRRRGAALPLDFAVRVRRRRATACRSVEDAEGCTGAAEGRSSSRRAPRPLLPRRSRSTSGGSAARPIVSGSFDLELSPGVGVGFSALHRVGARRWTPTSARCSRRGARASAS